MQSISLSTPQMTTSHPSITWQYGTRHSGDVLIFLFYDSPKAAKFIGIKSVNHHVHEKSRGIKREFMSRIWNF